MDKSSMKILKYLIGQGKGIKFVCGFSEDWGVDDDIFHMSQVLKMDVENLRANIRYLEKEGYIEYQKLSNGQIIGFFLSHKGLHCEEFRWIEIKRFLTRSILVPIVVAFITAILTSTVATWLMPK